MPESDRDKTLKVIEAALDEQFGDTISPLGIRAIASISLTAYESVAGWQPIESAPKDGTLMWLLVDGDAVIGRFRRPYLDLESDTGDWRISALFKRRERPDLDDGIALTAGSIEPTRWMPLPALPASPDGKALLQEESAEAQRAVAHMGSEKEKGDA